MEVKVVSCGVDETRGGEWDGLISEWTLSEFEE